MSDRKKSCEERIGKELEEFMEEVDEALDDSSKYDEFVENILGIDKKLTYTITLSWGGPASYIEIEKDPETGDITDIIYRFTDWFDGAWRRLTGKDWDKVEALFKDMLYDPDW